MEELLGAILRGLTFGSVYALLAVGLVVAYKTTGVFNLAFGAQAFVSGAVYYDTRVRHGWPLPAALLLAVVIVGPLLGVLLDRLIFRHLRTAAPMARLVTVIGLVVAIPEMVKLWFGTGPAIGGVGIVVDGGVTYQPFRDVFVSRDDIATIVAVVVVVGATLAIFRYSSLGLKMRAVVESPRMTELAGVNSDFVGMASWALSSFLAALAGVLLIPLFAGQVIDAYYTTLVVAAIAAAVFASLTSIPMALLGGLLLGIAQQLLAVYLDPGSIIATNLRPSLPFVAMFLMLAISPSLRHRKDAADPLAGVDPPPIPPASATRGESLRIPMRVVGVFAAVAYLAWLLLQANDKWLSLGTKATILGIVFLSVTVIAGLAGEVSLCQSTFAGIGAFATGHLATNTGMSSLAAMLIAALLAAVVGAMLAVPALRLGGIFLSLATLAFGLFFDNVMVKFSWVGGGIFGVESPRPLIGSLDFADDKLFLVLCVFVLAIVSALVTLVRNGTTGRYLHAVRGSEVAAQSIGINPTRTRIMAFALSAGIAGLGGALLGLYQGRVNYAGNFIAFMGLFWVVIVVTVGARSIDGAIVSGIAFVFFPELVLKEWLPWLVNHLQPWYETDALPTGLQFVLFGLGAVTYAKHPQGLLEVAKGGALALTRPFTDRRRPSNA